MIPLRLRLRNFMCYQDDPPPLDFAGVHLACLAGDNGAGKSALLGAMTWALWGKARERVPDDELITQGATEMEVDFEFALGEQRYRVIRKRNKKGRGQTMLNFEVWSDDTWKAITGHTVGETERKIVETLHLDYETFINSAFLLQGRADSFTMKNPNERKELLGDILGLDIYDRYQEAARKQSRDREAERNRLAGVIATLDVQIARKGLVEAEVLGRTGQHEQAQAAQAAGEARWQEIIAALQHLEGQERELAEAGKRLERDQAEVARLRRDADARRARIAGYEATLAERARIVDGHRRWQAAQTQEAALSAALTSLRRLEKEVAELERVLDGERNKLVNQAGAHSARIAEYERRSAGRAVREQELAEVLAALALLDVTEERRQGLARQLEEAQQQAAGIEGENKKLREEMDALKARMDRLDTAFADAAWHQPGADQRGTPCPLCEQLLDEDAFNRVRGSYEQEGKERGQRFRQNKRRHDDLLDEVEKLRKQLAALDLELRPRAMQQKRESTLERDVAAAVEAAALLDNEAAQLAAIEARLAAGDYAGAERTRLMAAQQEIAALDFDQAAYDAARRALAEFAPFQARHADLLRAETHLPDEQTALLAVGEQLAGREAVLAADVENVTMLANAVRDLPRLRRERDESRAALDRARRAAADAHALLTRAQGQLEAIVAAEAERAAHANAQEAILAEKSIYDELLKAFGKGGIQAMIIESVIPELEEEANTLLGRMTDGRMALRFETQRQARTSDSVIETLDIRINDESGTARRYELFSGGEAFRINFAVRIALSKLLARRAGAQLQTLVIDEGFGTQDGAGRERLIHAIRSIQDDFACILVITHIQELKEEFPTRIEVVRTGAGSRVAVM